VRPEGRPQVRHIIEGGLVEPTLDLSDHRLGVSALPVRRQVGLSGQAGRGAAQPLGQVFNEATPVDAMP
jgi:hypothetical protein